MASIQATVSYKLVSYMRVLTVFLSGVSVSGVTIAFTFKYQKKPSKVTTVVDVITSATAMFEVSLPKALGNGKIDE